MRIVMAARNPIINSERYDPVLFDLGVETQTG